MKRENTIDIFVKVSLTDWNIVMQSLKNDFHMYNEYMYLHNSITVTGHLNSIISVIYMHLYMLDVARQQACIRVVFK